MVMKPLQCHKGIFHAGFPGRDVEMTEWMKDELSVHLAKYTENL